MSSNPEDNVQPNAPGEEPVVVTGGTPAPPSLPGSEPVIIDIHPSAPPPDDESVVTGG